jgi:hypothetical protein
MRPLILLLLTIPAALAQDVADRYHQAAGLFVDGQNDQAEAVAEEALALAPTDRKLQALLDAIRQESPDSPESGGGGEDEGEQGEPEPSKSESTGEPPEEPSSEDPSEQGEGESDALQNDRSAQSDATGTQQPDGDGERDAPDAEQDPEADGASPVTPADLQPGQMTRAEAERILGALDADEEALLQQVQRRNTPPKRVQKDW